MWKQWSRHLALAGTFLFLVAPLHAQTASPGPVHAALGQRINLALWNRAELGLTDRQIQDLRALRADFEDRMVELRQETREARSQAREELREDREALRGDREARRQRMQEMRRQRQATRQRVQEVQAPFLERYGELLNADQREWLAARAARAARRGGPAEFRDPGERRGVRGGGWLRPAPEREFRGRNIRPGVRGGGPATPRGF